MKHLPARADALLRLWNDPDKAANALAADFMEGDASLTVAEAKAKARQFYNITEPKHPVWRSDGSFGKPE